MRTGTTDIRISRDAYNEVLKQLREAIPGFAPFSDGGLSTQGIVLVPRKAQKRSRLLTALDASIDRSTRRRAARRTA